MDLLEVRLPELKLRVNVDPEQFFNECEQLAASQGWQVDRRRNLAGAGHDQLNIHFGATTEDYPMLRMVSRPTTGRRLDVDVVSRWKSWPIDYDEYLTAARDAYSALLTAYHAASGIRYRLSVPRRPVAVDIDALDCSRIGYAAEKFTGLARSLAVGSGDARERLIGAFWGFHVIRPHDLPSPLREHLAWVYEKITARPGRSQFEGSVERTVRSMKNAMAAKILERLVDLEDAILRLDEACNRRLTRA